MSETIKVETYKVPADPKEKATQIKPSPVRTISGRHGSTQAKRAARDSLRQLGYQVRSISFTEAGIVAYVAGDPPPRFSSTKSGPRGGRKPKRG